VKLNIMIKKWKIIHWSSAVVTLLIINIFLYTYQVNAGYRGPPGFLLIAEMEGIEKHSLYSYCLGLTNAYKYFARTEDTRIEIQAKFNTYFSQLTEMRNGQRQAMIDGRLFSSKVDLLMFDIAAEVVYKDGWDYVFNVGPSVAIPKLESCVTKTT